ncbi:MFS transporter, partial [Alkalibaculum bacchi]|uniref:MFS transporter n=1 Tax=Alkalibaculum bacchi TaxID=645887 RepID=UPI0026EC2B90
MKTKHNKNHIKFAILAISSVLMTSMIASAILADISMSYPSADPSLIQMIMTLPSLMGMIFAISAGPLSGKIAKKIIVLVGLFSAFTGGMLSYLFGSLSIYVLLLSSALIGVGQGINSTMSMALIADYFVGDESSSLMGLQSAFVNGGSMVIIFISSLLARLGWRSSYLIFLIFIPIIVIVMKYLPNDPPIQQQESSGEKGKLNGTVYFTAVVTFVFATLMFSFATNVAMFVVNNGLGDATTAGL